jgi:hypothetical protein
VVSVADRCSTFDPDGQLVSMVPAAYAAEDLIQKLLVTHSDLPTPSSSAEFATPKPPTTTR